MPSPARPVERDAAHRWYDVALGARGRGDYTTPIASLTRKARPGLNRHRAVVPRHSAGDGADHESAAGTPLTHCLAPEIIEAILDGREPERMTLATLREAIPLHWGEQRVALGFSRLPPLEFRPSLDIPPPV